MSLAQFEGKALVFNNGVVDVKQGETSLVDENKVAHIPETPVKIDNLTIITNAEQELEVPFDNKTIYRDRDGFIKAKGGSALTAGDGIEIDSEGEISVASGQSLVIDSEGKIVINPVIMGDISNKQDKLTAGTDIEITEDNTINYTGSGGGASITAIPGKPIGVSTEEGYGYTPATIVSQETYTEQYGDHNTHKLVVIECPEETGSVGGLRDYLLAREAGDPTIEAHEYVAYMSANSGANNYEFNMTGFTEHDMAHGFILASSSNNFYSFNISMIDGMYEYDEHSNWNYTIGEKHVGTYAYNQIVLDFWSEVDPTSVVDNFHATFYELPTKLQTTIGGQTYQWAVEEV